MVPDVVTDVGSGPPALASCLYILLCTTSNRATRDRPPAELPKLMAAYNAFQVVYNTMNATVLFLGVYRNHLRLWGNPWTCGQDSRAFLIAVGVVMHYANKYVELLDTVFIVLRKKTQQLSYLHMYHHLLLLWSWLFVCRMPCCADAYFGATANSAVHVLMYSYYLLKSMGWNVSLGWKRRITEVQIAQFVACAVHSAYVLWKNTCAPQLPCLQLFVMLNMLYFFTIFYHNAYLRVSRREKKAA